MSKKSLRQLAQGQPCMIRVPGVCNRNPETTVLAHYRMADLCGVGMKPPDWCGAWACRACHDAVDGRVNLSKVWTHYELRIMHAEGVFRTLAEVENMSHE